MDYHKYKSLIRPKSCLITFQSDKFNPLVYAISNSTSNQMLQKLHHALSPILCIGIAADKMLGSGFDNPRITLPDATCQVSRSEVISNLIRTSADKKIGCGFVTPFALQV